MKLRGYVVRGNKAKLKLINRKYKYDSHFRERVDSFIQYNIDFDRLYLKRVIPIRFTADELLILKYKK